MFHHVLARTVGRRGKASGQEIIASAKVCLYALVNSGKTAALSNMGTILFGNRKWLLAIALGVLCVAFLASPAQAEERFAIVIGANPGWTNDRPLRYAEADAERVRDVLTELGGFSADRVTLMRDPETSEVRSELRRLAGVLRATADQTVVLVYYSGHADGTHLHLRGAPMSYADLESELRRLPASVRVGVLDSCQSGSIANKGGKSIAAFKLRTQDEARIRGLVLLASSGADELSQESLALAGSVFTHHLVSGLRGAADANSDEQISLAELYKYTYERTAADTSSSSVQQTPTFRFDLLGQGDLTLSRLTRRLATLSLPREKSRRYVVVDQQEWKLIAESQSDANRPVSLALPPGQYRVKRIGRQGIDVAELDLAPKGTVDASQLRYQEVPLSAGVVKGSPDDKSSVAYREWLRGKALARLADGKASSSLLIFEEVLAQWPGDWGALRGRARALIRLAESYDRLGDHDREQKALQEAIDSDPSLSEDPDFRSWYRRTENQRLRVQEMDLAKRRLKKRESDNPRKLLRWGFEFDTVSAKARHSIVGSIIVKERLMPYVSLDLLGTGVGAGLRVVALSAKWSPYISAGGHVSFATLGGQAPDADSSAFQLDWEERFGRSVSAEVGAQYLSGIGFALTLGFGLVFTPPHSDVDKVAIQAYPTIAAGWFFE